MALPSGPAWRPVPRRSRNAIRRAAVLILIQLGILAHVAHWLATGRTLSPLEPSEAMQTLERGAVNAGFLFFSLAILATALFGRFFCGWGCHIVALQDLCGWLMKKAGIRPRPFRSRLLRFVPAVLALYMFVWPAFKRLALLPFLNAVWPDAAALFRPLPPFPGFHLDLVQSDFWATFPPWTVAVPFLLICGFAAVWFLGSKGFCTYGCPYGAIFGAAGRLAPGQIIADLDKCNQCGHCTATCTSNVRVNEEIQDHGKVVDSGCMKCLDCVSVCPTNALSYKLARPGRALLSGRRSRRTPYDLESGEEIVLGFLFLAAFLAWRQAYHRIPMLMAAGIAGCSTFVFWKSWCLFRKPDVNLHGYSFRKDGRWLPSGRVFTLLSGCFLILTAHTGLVRYHLWRADVHDRRVNVSREEILAGSGPSDLPPAALQDAREALKHYRLASSLRENGLGLMDTPGIPVRMAWLSLVAGDRTRAEQLLRKSLREEGPSGPLCTELANVLLLEGKSEEAENLLRETLAAHPGFLESRVRLAMLRFSSGKVDEAAALLAQALEADPADARLRGRLASQIYLPAGRTADAVRELRRAVQDLPADPALRRDLAAALFFDGQREEASRELDAAAELASPGGR
ncbi:MAG: tetratricopeptide repeat protein [Planctomycetota bacterium]